MRLRAHGGYGGSSVVVRVCDERPVTFVVGVAGCGTRSIATPLLRSKKFLLHPFQESLWGITAVLKARHGRFRDGKRLCWSRGACCGPRWRRPRPSFAVLVRGVARPLYPTGRLHVSHLARVC